RLRLERRLHAPEITRRVETENRRVTSVTPAVPQGSLQPGLERGRGLRATQVLERVALDLADPLAGEVELLAHLVQRAGAAVVEAEAHAHDRSRAFRQRPQDRAQAVLQQAEVDHVGRHRRVAVLDELTEGRGSVIADRRLEREGLAAVAEDLLDAL